MASKVSTTWALFGCLPLVVGKSGVASGDVKLELARSHFQCATAVW